MIWIALSSGLTYSAEIYCLNSDQKIDSTAQDEICQERIALGYNLCFKGKRSDLITKINSGHYNQNTERDIQISQADFYSKNEISFYSLDIASGEKQKVVLSRCSN